MAWGRWILWIGLSSLALQLGCGEGETPTAPNRSSVDHSTTERTRRGESDVLFAAPSFDLTDQTGASFESQRLEGKIWIATFVFSRCAATCPRQMSRLAELQDWLDAREDQGQVEFVGFSVDPTFDTPEVLTRYGEQYDADWKRWHLLTGDRQTIFDVADQGFHLPASDSPLTHSSLFALVDGSGNVVGLFESRDDKAMRELESRLEKMLESSHWEQVPIPDELFTSTWLEERQQRELETANTLQARHDFQFADRRAESGIDFLSRGVFDMTREYRSNHYDHACGLAVADYDNDGWPDIYFVNQVGPNELWRNLGDGRFENVTEQAGVGLAERVSVSASFADTDNDGDPDLFVTTTRHGNVYFVNQGDGTFQDMTAESGLEYVGHSSAADFLDYDHDGRLDLLVTNVGHFTLDTTIAVEDADGVPREQYLGRLDSFYDHVFPDRAESSRLYHNEGDHHFKDVTTEMGLESQAWSGDATTIDVNHDGWLDLYVLDMQGNDLCYINREGMRFEEQSAEYFAESVWGGMGCVARDFDGDGRIELFVTNMHADMWAPDTGKELGQRDGNRPPPTAIPPVSYLMSRRPGLDIFGNGFFRQNESGIFEDFALANGTETYWPWGPSAGDLNADGYIDLFIPSSMNFPFRYHPNTLLLNEGGQSFRHAEFILGLEPRRDRQVAVPWVRLDLDGADRKHDLDSDFDGKIEVWAAVGSRSAVIVDIDNDGDLDIITNDFHSHPQLLISNLVDTRPTTAWLKLDLHGSTSNRDGLGAEVTLHAGDRRWMQVSDGQSGYLSQSDLPLYFGLDQLDEIDRIEVRWPNGTTQVINGPIPTRQTLVIDEATTE
ncbi:MAG: VCBS repeat-containing protein [Planctomycetales bacterium]|nr:VCBS repeat-containing protein [Planctomycetales bacterium]